MALASERAGSFADRLLRRTLRSARPPQRHRREAHGQGRRGPRAVRPQTYGRGVAKKYKAVRNALTDAGWSVVRQSGSHEVWAHPDRDQRIVVAGKDNDTVPVGTLGSIRRASGLEQLR